MNGFRLDKTKFEVVDMDAPDDTVGYWLTRPPEERIQALEMLRMIAYDRPNSKSSSSA